MSGTLCHICGIITYPEQSCGCAEKLLALQAQLDAAWAQYPYEGCVRGLGVSLAECVQKLVEELAETKSALNDKAILLGAIKALVEG